MKNTILRENVLGDVYFFGLLATNDKKNMWDVLISASNMKISTWQSDMTYVVTKFKEEFEEDFSFLSTIVLLTKEEDFIKNLGRGLGRIGVTKGQVSGLKLNMSTTLSEFYVIHSDFSDVDLRVVSTEKISDRKIPENSFN